MPISDDEMTYLTPADLYNIAEEVLGREPDVRDRTLLLNAAARPHVRAFGAEAYPGLINKAAALLHSLAAHHLFFDGNKRTATVATERFLIANGIQPTWSEQSIYDFVLAVAQHQHEVDAIAAWLENNTTSAEDTE